MDNLTQQEMQDALAYARVALFNDIHIANWSSEHFLETSLEPIAAHLREMPVIRGDFLKAMPESEVEEIAEQFLAVRALIEKMITFLTTYKTEEHFLDEIDNDLLCAWRGLDTYGIVLANDLAMRNYKRQAETEFANFEHMGEMIANTRRPPDEESTFFPYTSGEEMRQSLLSDADACYLFLPVLCEFFPFTVAIERAAWQSAVYDPFYYTQEYADFVASGSPLDVQ